MSCIRHVSWTGAISKLRILTSRLSAFNMSSHDTLQNYLLIFYNYHQDQTRALIYIIETFDNQYLKYQYNVKNLRALFLKETLDDCIETLTDSAKMIKETVDMIIGQDLEDILNASHPQDVKDILDTMILRLEGCYTTLSEALHRIVDDLDTRYYSYVSGPENANPMIDMLKHALITHRLLFAERIHTIAEFIKMFHLE